MENQHPQIKRWVALLLVVLVFIATLGFFLAKMATGPSTTDNQQLPPSITPRNCSREVSVSNRIDCTRNALSESDKIQFETFTQLTNQQKMEFDCAIFSNQLTVAQCEGNKKYLAMASAFQKGDVSYCEREFIPESYGERAAEYLDECLLSYVAEFSKEKDCSSLPRDELISECQQMLARQQSLPQLDEQKLKLAVQEDNVELCEQNTPCIDIYYLEKAISNDMLDLCSNIGAKGMRVQCQYSTALAQAILQNDVSICSSIEQELMAEACKEEYRNDAYRTIAASPSDSISP